MWQRRGIAFRLCSLMVVGAGMILGSMIVLSSAVGRQLLETELRARALFQATATADRITALHGAVEKVVAGGLLALGEAPVDAAQAEALLRRLVGDNPEVFGAALAHVPGGPLLAPYCHRAGDQLILKDLGADDYQYERWDWFTRPQAAGHGVWSDPYFDEGGGQCLMVTYSAPWYGPPPERACLGVLTCDVSLDWLTDLLREIPLTEHGYAFILARDGTFVSHPEQGLIMRRRIGDVADARGLPELHQLGQQMTAGRSGLLTVSRSVITGEQSTVAFAPVPSSGWSVGLVFADRDLGLRVAELGQIQLLVGILGFALLMLVALHIARRISEPIQRLDRAAVALVSDLHAPLPEIPGNDEVAELAASFRQMRDDLLRYIEELRVTTAEKHQMESEMAIARSIQMGLVPKTFPPFPRRRDLDLHAVLDPAREVSGDFYDFFLLDDDQLLLAIGDVSGKGVPAALFMAVSRTFLKAVAREANGPAEALATLNHELSEDNPTSMFVTLFCCVLDLRTGECRYASGGHDLPFLRAADGTVSVLPRVRGPLIGAMPGMEFEEGRAVLEPGDLLLAYTDGVTEAMDLAEELYGEPRLERAIRDAGGRPAHELTTAIRDDVAAFVGTAEQSDDVTLLAFRYQGPAGRA